MKAIINIQDETLGSWHQVTIEDGFVVRLDGYLVHQGHNHDLPDNDFVVDCIRMALAWVDTYEGLEAKEALS